MASITHDRVFQKKTEKHFVDLSTAVQRIRAAQFLIWEILLSISLLDTRIFPYQKVLSFFIFNIGQ